MPSWLQWLEAILGIVNDLESAGVVKIKEVPKIDAVVSIVTKRIAPLVTPAASDQPPSAGLPPGAGN